MVCENCDGHFSETWYKFVKIEVKVNNIMTPQKTNMLKISKSNTNRFLPFAIKILPSLFVW